MIEPQKNEFLSFISNVTGVETNSMQMSHQNLDPKKKKIYL